MEILITTSTGLCRWKDKYYLQIIHDTDDDRVDYFVPIFIDKAHSIAHNSSLEIMELENEPDFIHL